MNLSTFSRLGGLARRAALSPAQRRASASIAARAFWAKLTPEERSAEVTRRRAGTARRSTPASPAASTRTRRGTGSTGQ